jgi:sugar-specific transcriptional regulator TrmB
LRISLFQKLKTRKDFKEICKRLELSNNKIRYIEDCFSCGNLTARRCVDEYYIHVNGTGEYVKPSKDVIDEAKGHTFVSNVEVKLEKEPSLVNLLKLGNEEELLEFSVNSLKFIFNYFSDKKATVDSKIKLIAGIKYLIQSKYYEKVFKVKMPEKLISRTEKILRECYA